MRFNKCTCHICGLDLHGYDEGQFDGSNMICYECLEEMERQHAETLAQHEAEVLKQQPELHPLFAAITNRFMR